MSAAMEAWQIQPYVKTRLESQNTLIISSVTVLSKTDFTVLEDDGTYPKTPKREEALREKGLVIIVWQPDSDGLRDVARSGVADYDVYVPVLVEANVKRCVERGIEDAAWKGKRWVEWTVAGKPSPGGSTYSLVPMDPPFKNFAVVDGVHRIIVNFSYRQFITPAAT